MPRPRRRRRTSPRAAAPGRPHRPGPRTRSGRAVRPRRQGYRPPTVVWGVSPFGVSARSDSTSAGSGASTLSRRSQLTTRLRSSVGVISNGHCANTSPTTTPSGRTAGSACKRRTRRRIPTHRFPACCVFEEATSWAASSMSTNWSRDAESRVSVPFTLAVPPPLVSARSGSVEGQVSRGRRSDRVPVAIVSSSLPVRMSRCESASTPSQEGGPVQRYTRADA